MASLCLIAVAGARVWPLQSCCQSPCHCHLRVSTNDVVSQFRRKSRPFFTSLALSEDTGKGTTRCASDVFDFHDMTAFTRRVVSSSLSRLRADTTAIPWMFINGLLDIPTASFPMSSTDQHHVKGSDHHCPFRTPFRQCSLHSRRRRWYPQHHNI